ncbi:MAG: hypothetical protein V7K38_13940 [Nostoc sp.]|uniref:hypothetical protein n=1 Tax=Nostoc sp. TaxID=1180 RepID=UPI002FF8518E
MSKKILLVTVGKSPAPIVKAIQHIQPDQVVFLCSENFQSQIIGEGLPCEIIHGNSVKRYPNIPKLVELGDRFQPERDLKIIQNPHDLTTKLIVHAAGFGSDIQEEIERLRGDFEAADIDLNSDSVLPEVEQLVSIC